MLLLIRRELKSYLSFFSDKSNVDLFGNALQVVLGLIHMLLIQFCGLQTETSNECL